MYEGVSIHVYESVCVCVRMCMQGDESGALMGTCVCVCMLCVCMCLQGVESGAHMGNGTDALLQSLQAKKKLRRTLLCDLTLKFTRALAC